jgi:hypothetical protein
VEESRRDELAKEVAWLQKSKHRLRFRFSFSITSSPRCLIHHSRIRRKSPGRTGLPARLAAECQRLPKNHATFQIRQRKTKPSKAGYAMKASEQQTVWFFRIRTPTAIPLCDAYTSLSLGRSCISTKPTGSRCSLTTMRSSMLRSLKMRRASTAISVSRAETGLGVMT